jgi:hypothetical protein
MVNHHEIKVVDKTFKDIWSKRRNVKDHALGDILLPTCTIVVIKKSDFQGIMFTKKARMGL